MTERPTVWFRPLWLGLLDRRDRRDHHRVHVHHAVRGIRGDRRHDAVATRCGHPGRGAVAHESGRGLRRAELPVDGSDLAWGVAIGAAAVMLPTLVAHCGSAAARGRSTRSPGWPRDSPRRSCSTSSRCTRPRCRCSAARKRSRRPSSARCCSSTRSRSSGARSAFHQLVVGAAALSRRRRAHASPARLA